MRIELKEGEGDGVDGDDTCTNEDVVECGKKNREELELVGIAEYGKKNGATGGDYGLSGEYQHMGTYLSFVCTRESLTSNLYSSPNVVKQITSITIEPGVEVEVTIVNA